VSPGTERGFSADDHQAVRSLIAKVNAQAPLAAADIEAIDALRTRYPGEKGLDRLLATALMRGAEQLRGERRFAQAQAHLQRAAALGASDLAPRLALMDLLLETGDWSGAEAAARQAIAIDARSADAFRGLGLALMRQDRNREAAEALRTALALRDEPGARGLLGRIERGLRDEQGMRDQQVAHFNVRYDGEVHEAVGREVLRVLERHYATLVRTFDHQPATAIPVILFTRQRYLDATDAPQWSGGVYDRFDGRIRVPVGELTTQLPARLDATLMHEVVHAFVNDMTQGRAPAGLNEGVAQYLEGRRTQGRLGPEQIAAFVAGATYEQSGDVRGFYLAALSFAEFLIGQRTQGGVNDLLKAMGTRGDADSAFRDVYGQDYATLRVAWGQWISRRQ
jgi:hypothetical protein